MGGSWHVPIWDSRAAATLAAVISRRTVLSSLAALPLPPPGMAAPVPNAAGHLRLVATEFPPYTTASLADHGAAVAITRAAVERAGMTMELQYRPWVRALNELQQGQWDGVIGAWHSVERESFLAYPRALGITNKIGFMARAGAGIAVDDLKKLAGLTIGVVRDYANPPAFEQAQLRKEEAIDDLTNLRKLAAGRVDLALVDKGVAFHILQTQLREHLHALSWLDPAVADMPLYTAFSRKMPDLAARVTAFSRALNEMQGGGELQRILQRSARWF